MITSELIKRSRIFTSLSVTESCCDDTPRDSKQIREAVLRNACTNFDINFLFQCWVYDTKSTLKIQ